MKNKTEILGMRKNERKMETDTQIEQSKKKNETNPR